MWVESEKFLCRTGLLTKYQIFPIFATMNENKAIISLLHWINLFSKFRRMVNLVNSFPWLVLSYTFIFIFFFFNYWHAHSVLLENKKKKALVNINTRYYAKDIPKLTTLYNYPLMKLQLVLTRFQSWLFHLIDVWTWMGSLISVCPSFFICQKQFGFIECELNHLCTTCHKSMMAPVT